MPLRVNAEAERLIVLAGQRVPRPSQLEVATEFGLSQAGIGGIWRRNGICLGKGARPEGYGRGRATSAQIKQQILALAKDRQLSQGDIARRMAIPRTTVAKVMRQGGEIRESGTKTPYQKYKNSLCPIIRLLGGGMERRGLSLESLARRVGYGKNGNSRQASDFLLQWFSQPNKRLPPYEAIAEMAKVLGVPASEMDEAYRNRVQPFPRTRDRYCLSIGGRTYFLPDIYDLLSKEPAEPELPLMPVYKCPKCERELPLAGWFHNRCHSDSKVVSFPRCRWCTNLIRAKRKRPEGKTRDILHTVDRLIRSAGGIAWPRLPHAGYPDLTILLPSGKTILTEVKAPGDGPTTRQLDCAMQLRQQGCPVAFVFFETFEDIDAPALISCLEESAAGFPGRTRLSVSKGGCNWKVWE
jgi:transcriptional regulator with XRE-family HTH domain